MWLHAEAWEDIQQTKNYENTQNLVKKLKKSKNQGNSAILWKEMVDRAGFEPAASAFSEHYAKAAFALIPLCLWVYSCQTELPAQ